MHAAKYIQTSFEGERRQKKREEIILFCVLRLDTFHIEKMKKYAIRLFSVEFIAVLTKVNSIHYT